MKTTKDKICGGYLHVPWQESNSNGNDKDDQVFIFSIDRQLKLTPMKGETGILFDLKRGYGP